MSFSTILEHAVQELQKANIADPLPVLRSIIKECPRIPCLEFPPNDSGTLLSALELSKLISKLIINGRGSVPQVAALALACILPSTVGIRETSVIFSNVLVNKDTAFGISLLQNIESVIMKHDSSISPSNLQEQERNVTENSIACLHLVNAIMQCPTSKLLLLQLQEHGNLLLNSLFNVIESACISLVTRNHPSTIKAFASWLRTSNDILKTIGRVAECDEDADSNVAKINAIFPCLSHSLCILNCCLWDNKAFGSFLDLSTTISEVCSEEQKATFKMTSNNLLLCTMWELPWRNKRKLQMLAELLPRCGVKLILSQYSDLPNGIKLSLAYNELQSAGADVYKVLLKALNEEEFDQHFAQIHIDCIKDRSTIQGFANYWLPALIKRFPNLVKAIESKITGNLMAQIVLLQVQRKEGVINLQTMLETSEYYHLLCNGLSVYDADIRTQSFDALCTGINQNVAILTANTMHTTLNLTHGFIMDNLSVASQAARHSIIRSMSSLLPAVRDYLSILIKNKPNIDLLKSESSKPSASFLRWLYHFLVHNLEPGNNYQRHITSLRLYHIVLQSFSTSCPTTKVPLAAIIKTLEKFECWPFESPSGAKAILKCVLSPTDDVRATAASILISTDLSIKLPNPRQILCEGLKLCSSQQFYTVESGSLLFTVGALCIPELIQQIFEELLLGANKQFTVLQEGLVIGALKGSPVHGVLQIMLFLLQEDTVISALPKKDLISIVELIENVTSHLLTVLNTKSSSQDFAPSFEDMDLAIESQLYENYNSEEKSLHLTPQYQIAVNCAWLNLKVCCELASQLGSLLSKLLEKDEPNVERCGQIIISVLQKCRHKGAFEAAGVALSGFVRDISASGSKVHQILLEQIMTTLTHRGKDAPPLSRRSAGLAVAVHRLVTFDTDIDKFLLHRVIIQLLNELQTEEERVEVGSGTQWALVDTLTARLMHVLFALVSDSATRYHMAQHLENIALASLRRLSSTNWGIRNAAMQLFGAVVSKLTAQRQYRKCEDNLDQEQDNIEDDWDAVGTGLIEDLEMSRPKLLNHLRLELRRAAEELVQDPTVIRNHTSLVFHLGLLVRMTPGPPALQTQTQATIAHELCTSCWILLGCSEWAVRAQAAACVLSLTSVPQLPQLLSLTQQQLTDAPENRRHGCLLLIAKTENKINMFLQLMPKELDLNKCHASTITLNKAQIKPTGSYVCHQFIKFKDIKKGDFFRILRELSKYPCSKHVAKMLWTANLAENVVLTQKGIPAADILDKCLEAESLFYIQERVLATMYIMISNNKLIDEMLDIQLILYETLDQVLISLNCSRHKLMLVIKVLVAIKRKTTEKYIKDNMKEFHMTSSKTNELESANKIKQWVHVIGETLWVQPLISLLEENLYGDEFELYAFELLGLYALELVAAKCIQECVEVLTALTELMQQNLQEDLPHRSSVGRALAAISLVTWNLQPLCSYHDVTSGNIGYIVLLATGELLSEHNIDAARSIWPLSSKRNGESLNPVFCLRQMCKLGPEKLMTSKMIYSYLWQQLTINVEELHQSAVIDKENIVSPFSHPCAGMDLETLDFIASGFKDLDVCRRELISKDPQLAALMPDFNFQLPGSSIHELRVNTKELMDSITTFRKQATGPLQWLPLELQIGIRKLCLQLWVQLETLQENGINLSLTDLDGVSAQERVYHLRRHLNTVNQLDSPDRP